MAAALRLHGHQDEPLGPSVAPGSVAQPLLHPHVSSRVTVPPAATPRWSHWDSVPWAHGPHRGAGGAQVPLLAGADALACECRLFGVHSAPSSREWDEARALTAGTGQAECSGADGRRCPPPDSRHSTGAGSSAPLPHLGPWPPSDARILVCPRRASEMCPDQHSRPTFIPLGAVWGDCKHCACDLGLFPWFSTRWPWSETGSGTQLRTGWPSAEGWGPTCSCSHQRASCPLAVLGRTFSDSLFLGSGR